MAEIDEDSACTEANDSLRVLFLHGKRPSVEMNASSSVEASAEAGTTLLSLTDVAGGGMQIEDDIGDLDDTQVAEPSCKRYKEDSVAKDMLMRCAKDRACTATEMKAITSQLLQDAAVSAERDAAMAERAENLAGLVKAVSLRKIRNLLSNNGCKNNGRCLSTDGRKIVQPDDKEGAITQAQHRIRMAVHRDADERWKTRMANERTDLDRPGRDEARIRSSSNMDDMGPARQSA